MSMRKYAKMLLRRYPRERTSQNVPLLLDVFDISTRHEARFPI
jgi:hypothetical protein